jgi:hypothetical protein
LNSPRQSRWILGLSRGLLEGSDDIEELLEHDPFANESPEFVRILRYRYEFTSGEQRAETGNWWRRSGKEVYLRPISLETSR